MTKLIGYARFVRQHSADSSGSCGPGVRRNDLYVDLQLGRRASPVRLDVLMAYRGNNVYVLADSSMLGLPLSQAGDVSRTVNPIDGRRLGPGPAAETSGRRHG